MNDDPIRQVVMRRTGNGQEVLIYRVTASGRRYGYTPFPTEEAALNTYPLNWSEPDAAVRAGDPDAIKAAPFQPLAATPVPEVPVGRV